MGKMNFLEVIEKDIERSEESFFACYTDENNVWWKFKDGEANQCCMIVNETALKELVINYKRMKGRIESIMALVNIVNVGDSLTEKREGLIMETEDTMFKYPKLVGEIRKAKEKIAKIKTEECSCGNSQCKGGYEERSRVRRAEQELAEIIAKV